MDPLAAASPADNATVMASAGTGKTWLLVTRLVRLLLAGARPESIVAITFTRKAAMEMQSRLSERLLEMATADGPRLEQLLREQGIPTTKQNLAHARDLYERLLCAPQGVRTTTFHAFCQEILRRFPLEAEIPAGFELLENSGILEQEAWDALFSEATRQPDTTVAKALETLFLYCDGLFNAQNALLDFLGHRSDWWAFTEGQADPSEYAGQILKAQLGIGSDTDPLVAFFTPERIKTLEEYASLLSLHGTKTNLAHCETLSRCLKSPSPANSFAELAMVFLTRTKEPRSLRPSKARTKAMGEQSEARFVELHAILCEEIRKTIDQRARQRTLQLSAAWFLAGNRLIEHYQRIKEERRLLDFTDLEWRAYKLLNDAGNALWIQYKLDQRIDHLLIDEFQDTNPTQWHLLLPLLEEMAAGETNRTRSVFLVGDGKQSIYRFRRAEPRLFDTASRWLAERLGARRHPMDKSWRSAPAITAFVNRLFGSGKLNDALPHFQVHDTHRQDLWGKVELLPLIELQQESPPPAGAELRDPLQEPRQQFEDRRYYEEGKLIATTIQKLVRERILIKEGDTARPVNYGDILILVARRTHLSFIERALREAEIPYLGADKGTLLESQEIRDIEALLETLSNPHNNLPLAVTLRSPVFSCSDDDLLTLARETGGSWWERLSSLTPPSGSPLARAKRLLPEWRESAARLPVHDLLQRIYSEGNIPLRFEAAYPRHLRSRVKANLERFLQLALEVDAGRYPSLMRFIDRLRGLRETKQDAPDEAPDQGGEPQVRLMTIHAAKGLEAPVVFLADSASSSRQSRSWRALVRWPPDAKRPDHFLLVGRKEESDSYTQTLVDEESRAMEREDANLLYVAVTRAKQFLFISASAPKRGSDLGWYGRIQEQFEAEVDEQGGILSQSGTPPVHPHRPEPLREKEGEKIVQPDPRLYHPLTLDPLSREIAPSRQTEVERSTAGDPEGRLRGTIIHRMLELLSREPALKRATLLHRIAAELQLEPTLPLLASCHQEAVAVLEDPSLRWLFDARQHRQTFNELPLLYERDGKTVHGIIDRLLVDENCLTLIDYKTHQNVTPENVLQLAEEYRQQMEHYALGVRKIWPERALRTLLLFTSNRILYEFPDLTGNPSES